MTWTSIGNIHTLYTFTVPILPIFIKGGQWYWADRMCTKTSNLILTFDHVTWKFLGFIYSYEASTVPSLATFIQRGQNILSEHRLVYRLTDRCKTKCHLFSKGSRSNLYLYIRQELSKFNKKCFRNIYAPHGANFRFIFSIEAKPVQSKYARD